MVERRVPRAPADTVPLPAFELRALPGNVVYVALNSFGSDEGLSGNDVVLRISTSAAGGGTLSAVAVAGDPAFLLLERCND